MIALLLDAGNSRLKWALYDQQERLVGDAVDYPQLGQLGLVWKRLPSPHKILACNVAGPVVRGQITKLLEPQPIEWLRASPALAGVCNHYREPQQLGADRWAALIGARGLAPDDDLIVAVAGTALTVDTLTRDGDFLGGIIVPGLALMRKALAKGTADLGLPDGLPAGFPRTTGEAIVNGALAAMAGAIRQQQQQLEAFRQQPATVILSGGDAPHLRSLLQAGLNTRLLEADNLVLAGLARLAQLEDAQAS